MAVGCYPPVTLVFYFLSAHPSVTLYSQQDNRIQLLGSYWLANPQQGTVDMEIKVPFVENSESSKVLPLKTQYVQIWHASHIAKNQTLFVVLLKKKKKKNYIPSPFNLVCCLISTIRKSGDFLCSFSFHLFSGVDCMFSCQSTGLNSRSPYLLPETLNTGSCVECFWNINGL